MVLYEAVCAEVTPAGYKLEQVSRSTGTGGGVAVIYKTALRCKKQKTSKYNFFDLVGHAENSV